MFVKLKRSIVPALFAIALVVGSAGAASAHMHGGRGGLGVPLHLLLRTADLTPSQMTQVHQIFAASRSQVKSEFEQIRAAREDIAAKYASTGTVSANDFATDLAKISQARAQLEQLKLQDALAVRALLTPAQLSKVAQTQQTLDNIHAQLRSLFAQAGSGAAGAGQPTPAE